MRRISICPFLVALLAAVVPARAEGPSVVFSADTEGHAGPCMDCPGHPGLGGLARRATAVAGRRAQVPVLLLDAGNALYGPDSIAGNGGAIVEAYNHLAYDAVNLTPRDLRLGKQSALEALKAAKFDVVSANLLDAGTNQAIAKPYVVKKVADRRVAVIGVSEPPAGTDYLPHLKRQLSGVKIVPPADALARVLPKARGEADDVVVLYYGSGSGAKKTADSLGKDVAAFLVGGTRPEELPQGSAVPLVATAQHGRSLACLTLGSPAAPEQIALDDSFVADPEMTALLADATRPASGGAAGVADQTASADATAPADGGDAREGPVRKLVPAKAAPIEPVASEAAPPVISESAPTATAQVPDVSSAQPEPSEPKPARAGGGGSAWGFLKSLVGGSKRTEAAGGSAAPQPVQPAEEPPVREAEVPAAEPVAPPARQPVQRPARGTASTGPKFCTSCGGKLQPNARFCTSCGQRVRR